MNKNILLVEDDPLLSEMYLLVLEEENYNVTLVKDGKTAIKTNLDDKDLVLLDIRIPEINGLEVLKNYRKKGFKKPIVVLTNSPQVNYQEAKKMGASGFLVKSHTDIEQVTKIVAEYLRQS